MNHIRFIFVLFCLHFLNVVGVSALTHTDSFGGRSATVTVTFDPGTNLLTWSASHTGSSGGYAASAQLYKVSAHGSTTPKLADLYVNSAPQGNTGSGTYPASGGDYFLLQTYISGPSSTFSLQQQWFLCGQSPHVITVTPSSGTIDQGADFEFNVSGHQTSPSFSIEGISLDVGGYRKTFDQIGIHSFNVWAPAGNGYSESNTVTVTVTVRGYRIRVPLAANTGDYTVMYDVSQGGTVITSLVQLKGAPARTQIVEVPGPGNVTVTPRIVGVKKDGSLWVEDSTEQTNLTPTIVTPVPVVDEGDEVPESTVTAPQTPKPGVSDSEKSVWNPTSETDVEAKDNTMKEGFDKVVSAVDAVNATLKARLLQQSGPDIIGGGEEGENLGEKIDQTNEHLQKIADRTDLETDAIENNPTPASVSSTSSEQRTATEQAFGSAQTPTITAPAAPTSQGMLLVTIPGHGSINLDPASDPDALALCNFIKQVISWIALLVYSWFAWGEFKTLCALLTVAPQAKGNPVIGGTGAQATAIVAAVAITVLLVSFPSLYWAFSQLPEDIASNPFAGATGVISGISLYLLYLVIPVGLILTLISQAFALRKFGLVTSMAIATSIRFIVP